MSFLRTNKDLFPVFDIPDKVIYKTGFVDRRLPTVVAKSLLSGKNGNTKPATEYKFRKCYVTRQIYLYRFQALQKIKPIVRLNYPPFYFKDNSYYYPVYTFYNYRRIKHKFNKYSINIQSPKRFNIAKSVFNYGYIFEQKYNNSFVYLDYLKIEKKIIYNEKENTFIIQNKDSSLIHNILSSTGTIDNLKKNRINNQILAITNQNKPIFNTYLIETILYDFSKYKYKYNEKFILIGISKKLGFYEIPNKLKNKYSEENKNLYFKYNYIERFDYYIQKINENFSNNEFFAKFCISVTTKLLPYIEKIIITEKQKFSLDISTIINDSQIKTFNDEKIKKQESVFTLNNKYFVVPNSLNNKNSEKIKIIDNIINNNVTHSKKFLFKENHLTFILLKYKKPRLALKLKISKPRFETKTIDFYTFIKKGENTIAGLESKHKLSANFNKIKFIHNSPKIFIIPITKESLNIEAKYKQKKSVLYNKCPKHANYTSKSVKNIVFKQSFKKSLKQKFLKDDFISIRYKLKSILVPNFKYVFGRSKIDKIAYIHKLTIKGIESHKNELKSILISNKFKNIKRIKAPVDFFTFKKRLGLNHIKSLKSFSYDCIYRKNKFCESYLSPLKRIIVSKSQIPIFKGYLGLGFPKVYEEKYIHNIFAQKDFIIKYTKDSYSFCDYLPKQICNSFELKFDILGIKLVSIILQKNIIPPPGWRKLARLFPFKIRLGPFPFGFPDFSYPEPIFISLFTKINSDIKDRKLENIYKKSRFILGKNRLYLHELSMKMPRRLLYTELTPKNSPKEFFKNKNTTLVLLAKQPPRIQYFDYYWLHEKNTLSVSNKDSSLLIKERIEEKTINLINTNIKNINNRAFYNINRTKSINISMTPIDSFIIKDISLEANKQIGILKNNNKITKINYSFSIRKTLIVNNIFLSKIYKYIIPIVLKNQSLEQEFPQIYPVKELYPNFTTRFRSFHFPYIPDFKTDCLENRLMIIDKNNENIGNCRFQEDFRISESDFNYPDIKIVSEEKNEIDISYERINKMSLQEFKIQIRSIQLNQLSKILSKIDSFNELIQTIEIYIPEYYQHIITPQFFKIKVALSYKYKRRGKIFSSFKYLPLKKFSKESFTYQKYEYINPIDSPSFYWIILLRKNYIFTHKSKYINSVELIENTEVGKPCGLKNQGQEAFFFDKIKSPLLKQVLRKKILVNGINEHIFNRFKLPNINYSLEISNNIGVIKDLDMKKDNKNNLYKTKTLNYCIQLPNLKKEKIIEPNGNILNFKKKKMVFPNFRMSKGWKKLEFSNISCKSLNYRPIYIPEFIDIQPMVRESIFVFF